MSDNDLYEIARQRVDRRNRNLTFLLIHGAALTAYVGVFIMLAQTVFGGLALAGLIAWSGLFILHCVLFGLGLSRDNDIEGEVRKLRKATANDYEKPKRLALGEDGEIVESEEKEYRAEKLR